MLGRLLAHRRSIVALVAISMLAAACAGGAATLSTVGNSVGGGGAGPQPAATAAPAAPGDLFSARDSASTVTPGGSQPDGRGELLIIKTGSLALRVKDMNAAVSQARNRIDALGGYVSGSQQYGEGDEAVASVTYRIPADRWDAALDQIRALGDKVLSEETRTEEVTGQVLDLGARIANLQATEKALQAIMVKAVKISDVLAVQQQLTEVRGQIEQLATQKKHLEEQAAFSTLTVTFSLTAVAFTEAQKAWEPATQVDAASASLVSFLQAIATAGIWLVIVWLPALGILALVALPILFLARRVGRRRRQFGSPPALGGPSEG